MKTDLKIKVSLAAAYASGCIPCFDHYFMIAKEEQISEEDIQEIIAVAKKVRNGADIAISKAASDIIEGVDDVGSFDLDSHPCRCS